MLYLHEAMPIGEGKHRVVYVHPEHSNWLVKVLRPMMYERVTNGPWYKRLYRVGPYRTYMTEFKEYLASRHAADGPSPLARVVGLDDTDLGLGLLVERIYAADGGVAPNLAQWVARDGFDASVRAALDAFQTAILEHNVIAKDLDPHNVVYGCDEQGGPRLIMIDGFGERNFIPHRSMSRRHNAKYTRRKFAALYAQLQSMANAAMEFGENN